MHGFIEAFAQHEKNAQTAVIHNTWGHLFPKGEHYTGKLRIAYSAYAEMDHSVIDEKIGIDGSPWWYQTLCDFAYESKELIGAQDGEVWDININADVVTIADEGEEQKFEDYEIDSSEPDWEPYEMNTHEEIQITIIDKKRLLEAF